MRVTDDEARLTRYLLGQLDQDEQALIEERYLADPAFHEELRAAERDLIDQYVRGELAEREAFERHFLASPPRRQRVEFARALNRSLAHAPAVAPGSSRRVWQLLAASLVMLAGGWLLILGWRQANPVQQADRVPQEQTERGQPQAVPSIRQPDTTPGSRPEAAPPIRVATFVLTPNLTRDSAETRTLIVEDDTELRLQLEFEPGDYKSYRAVLRTGDRVEIWRQDQLTPQPTPTGQAIFVSLPASRFSGQDYTITLSGVTPRGEFEDVSGYYFRVQRK